MDVQQKTALVKSLAMGLDPFSQQPFPEDSVYNNPVLVRELFELVDYLQNPGKKIKLPPMTDEQKREHNIQNGLSPNAGLPWTEQRKLELHDDFQAGISVPELIVKHERSRGSITSELKRQGLIEM